MTSFEQMLLDKGYIKYVLNCKIMKYEIAEGHELSSMGNIDHRYFHKTDTNILNKIANGDSVMDKITNDDRKNEITFGLHERGKPPTLIHPRPRIEIKKIKDNKEVLEREWYDDSMNVVLLHTAYDEILKAMFDRSIILKFDFTTDY